MSKFVQASWNAYSSKNYIAALVAAFAAAMAHEALAAEISRLNVTTTLDSTSAWSGGQVPGSGDVAVFSSGISSTGASGSVGAGVNFGGIKFSSNPGTNITISANGTSSLTLGASGVDISAGNRTLTIAAPVVLGASQTWKTGNSTSGSQISVTGAISGSGSISINGTVGSPLIGVFLSNSTNTFSGGVVLNNGGALRISNAGPAYTGGAVTASSIGSGNLTVNGGTIFSAGGSVAPQKMIINGNFAVNSGTDSQNNRFTFAGGNVDLSSGIRQVSLGRFATAATALTGGLESFRFLASNNSSVSAPALSVSNGTISFVRGATGAASDFVAVNFSLSPAAGNVTFSGGAGLSIGQNVITTLGSSNPFGTIAGDQPKVNVDSGGYFNLSDAANARSPQIRILTGVGSVTNLSNNASVQTSILTINAQSGDSGLFSGSIANGTAFNSALGLSSNGAVALTKSGAGTQILSGNNTYTGATTLNGGMLVFRTTSAKSASSTVTASAGTTVGLGVGGSGYFSSADVDALFGNTLSGFVLNASTVVGIDTTAGDFVYASNQNAARSLTKLGANTLTLSGLNTYSGSTTVSEGTLLVNGSIGGSGVTIASGAAIGGSGSISSGVTFATGAKFIFNATASLNVSGTTALPATFGVDDLVGLTSGVAYGSYTLIGGSGSISITSLENLGAGNAYDLGSGKNAYFDIGSDDLALVVAAAIPEPSGFAVLASFGVLCFAALRRRRP